MNRIVLNATDLDGYLNETDRSYIEEMDGRYSRALELFRQIEASRDAGRTGELQQRLIALYNEMGQRMQEIARAEPRIHVYSFETPQISHGEASRLIAKLRSVRTANPEFIYYTQRAYELLFNFTFASTRLKKKNYIIEKTPVNIPVQNYAVHKIPDVDEQVSNSVMCVMLRAALLPSMIVSKEIQEYSSDNYITPFALFRIKRNETRDESDMEYMLDLDRSYFDLNGLQGKDLFFADPMNATGGSLVTIVQYLTRQGVKPRSIKFLNVISVLKGSLRIIRALENAEVYTLWMDPALNAKAYILPGLGDAGDRINGLDGPEHPRNILQLVADYGTGIASLYRDQLQEIEDTVLGR